MLRSQVDENDLRQDRVEWALLQLNGQVAEHFAFKLIVSSKLLSLVYSTMKSHEPGNEGTPSIVAVRRLMVIDQLTFFPGGDYALELGLKVALCLRVRQLTGQRTVEVVYGAEVVAIFARDDGELVVGMARVGVQFSGQAIVSLCGAPVALLVLLYKLGFAVTGKITEVNQSLVARLQDLIVEGSRDALAWRRFGCWYYVSGNLI
jgi:hypothetical protein